ncbi:MAG: virulence RhuM family protein [Elusimicrobia bacterium]|nr:virulence RhuM family protein [Elusimicrobiota bacterium]
MRDLIPKSPAPGGEFLLYQTQDRRTRIQCRLENETIWLTQALIAELFQKDVRTINEHLVNIFDEGELSREATIRKFRIVRLEGRREVARDVDHYRLEVILAVGYRVRSHRGTQFRQWATTRPGGIVRKEDVSIAKNYLTEEELQVLNRIVNLYLEYAELQALERKPMTMRDWITKLDDFLKTSGRKLLDHAGKISAEAAKAKAEREYERYRALLDSQPRVVDAAFEAAVKELKKLPAPRRKKKKK